MPKTSKDYLPKQIKLGHFVIDIQLIDGTVSLNIAEQQGSFIARDQVIYLDKEIMTGQPDRAINLIIHELMQFIINIIYLKKAVKILSMQCLMA